MTNECLLMILIVIVGNTTLPEKMCAKQFLMKHDEILKRARLLAQAANEAAEAAIAESVNSGTNDNNLQLKKETTAKKSSLPPVNAKGKGVANEKIQDEKPKRNEKSEKITTRSSNHSFSESASASESESDNFTLPVINQQAREESKTIPIQPDELILPISVPIPTVLPPPHELSSIEPQKSSQFDSLSGDNGAPQQNAKIEENEPKNEIPISSIDQSIPVLQRNDSINVTDNDENANDPISQYIKQYLKSRSSVVHQKHAPQQVLCYICCNEFGTSSLLIHQKTCLSKHQWALERILNDETMSIKEAKKNWKKCETPSNGSTLPALPSTGSNSLAFEQYNLEAMRLFFTHVLKCLWCRMNNSIAKMIAERIKNDDEERRRRQELEEEERRRRAKEEEDRRRKEAEDEEERKRREEEERRRREEEERRRMQLEDEASEAERRRLLALGKHSFLRKGKGTQAATQTAKLMEEKERNDRAKQEIVNYSLNQAKKKGYVSEGIPKEDKTSSVKYVEVTDEEMANLLKQNNESHAVSGDGAGAVKAWDEKWTLEEEEIFANSEVILRNKCI